MIISIIKERNAHYSEILELKIENIQKSVEYKEMELKEQEQK